MRKKSQYLNQSKFKYSIKKFHNIIKVVKFLEFILFSYLKIDLLKRYKINISKCWQPSKK